MPSSSLDGTWKIGSGSTAGYRVKETLFGQSQHRGRAHEHGDRHDDHRGWQRDEGFVHGRHDVDHEHGNGNGERDGQFQGRIMDTSDFPTSTFTLTSPIALGTPRRPAS